MMLLGWESNTYKYMAESAKLEGGNLNLGGGKFHVPHLLYEILVYDICILNYWFTACIPVTCPLAALISL